MARRTYGATGRYGTRYGKTTRDKIGRAEESVKKSTKCPYCNKDKVKRESTGIWHCQKCGSKFTGRAYTFDRKSILSGSKKSEAVSLDIEKAHENIDIGDISIEEEITEDEVKEEVAEEKEATESDDEKKE